MMQKKDLTEYFTKISKFGEAIGLKVLAAQNDKYFFDFDKKEIHIPLDEMDNLHKLSISFHECAHSTDLEFKRCDPNSNYDFEELVAELCAFMLLEKIKESNYVSKIKNMTYLSCFIKNLKTEEHKYTVKEILTKVMQYAEPAMNLIVKKGDLNG